MSAHDDADFFEVEESKSEAAAALLNSSQVALYALATGTSMFIARRRFLAHIADAPEPEYISYVPSRVPDIEPISAENQAAAVQSGAGSSSLPQMERGLNSVNSETRERHHASVSQHPDLYDLQRTEEYGNYNTHVGADSPSQQHEALSNPLLEHSRGSRVTNSLDDSSNASAAGSSSEAHTESTTTKLDEHLLARIQSSAASGPIVAYIRPPLSNVPAFPPSQKNRNHRNSL